MLIKIVRQLGENQLCAGFLNPGNGTEQFDVCFVRLLQDLESVHGCVAVLLFLVDHSTFVSKLFDEERWDFGIQCIDDAFRSGFAQAFGFSGNDAGKSGESWRKASSIREEARPCTTSLNTVEVLHPAEFNSFW